MTTARIALAAADLDRDDLEWLAASGDGSYAMGTPGGVRTRRYHGLLVAADPRSGRRHLALAALEPVLLTGTGAIALTSSRPAADTVHPGTGLVAFEVVDGVPRWRWQVGPVVLERELALLPGRGCVGVVDRLVSSPGPVRLRWEAVATWTPAGQVATTAPTVLPGQDCCRVGEDLWLRWVGSRPAARPAPGGTRRPTVTCHYREEAERGYPAGEHLPVVAAVEADLAAGDAVEFLAWVGPEPGVGAAALIERARRRTRGLLATARADDTTDALLVHAADQFVLSVGEPGVIAGYPWFGQWSRDTLTAYEGLFLVTQRHAEGAALLEWLAATVSQGMLANTADFGALEYNTADAAMWFLHAVERHGLACGEDDLAVRLLPTLDEIVEHHLAGTRFGISVGPDGLLRQGAPGVALTWMDARVDGVPVTPRTGAPVEVNALWVAGLDFLARLHHRTGRPAHHLEALHSCALASFLARFTLPGGGLADVVGGPGGTDASLRPNQLLATALPGVDAVAVATACASLATPLGPRSLGPAEPGYAARYSGPMPARDAVYHQGTVWPWLIGPWVDTLTRAGLPTGDCLDPLVAHLHTAGLGSVSEVADAEQPQRPSGCPFQAWSVAELLRVRRQQGSNGATPGR